MCPRKKLGVFAGTTYADFIRNMHLPSQLSAVDPIVASFCGGAIGVLTTLLLVELYNSDIQAKNRCIYCGVSLHQLSELHASKVFIP